MNTPLTYSTDLPESLLEIADDIKLSDLLDCPSTQAAAISMISNASKYSHLFNLKEKHDQELDHKILRINNGIPSEARHIAFKVLKDQTTSYKK